MLTLFQQAITLEDHLERLTAGRSFYPLAAPIDHTRWRNLIFMTAPIGPNLWLFL
jgi:hypothetical protein